MEKDELIPSPEFCSSHNLELSFIYSLQQYGLVETTIIEEISYIPVSQLPHVERIARLHSELGINIEGIDAIRHLLGRVEDMRNEIMMLKNRLRIYEDNE